MADNYLLFSEIVPKPGRDEEAWLQAQLQQIAVHGDEETAINGLDDQANEGADWYGPRFLRDYGNFDFESDTLGFDFCFQDDTDPGGWGRHLWVFSPFPHIWQPRGEPHCDPVVTNYSHS
jgi:hypothetical protein